MKKKRRKPDKELLRARRINKKLQDSEHTVVVYEAGNSNIVVVECPLDFHYDKMVFKQLEALPKPPDMPIEEDDDR